MSQRLEDIRGFYRLFQETAARSAFFAEPYGFFLNLGAALFPGGHAALFLASWEGELLSAVLVVFFGRRAT
ncbi:GNAT family N-acetyltransferase, partial [Klebsiella pneumoniae]|uniref:GNAT family N-acetyltransferase n=1 Tax=Klebsiella pneumoniae TaxID=573 RepID=UPI003EE2908E